VLGGIKRTKKTGLRRIKTSILQAMAAAGKPQYSSKANYF
jgi:hypothetical protein